MQMFSPKKVDSLYNPKSLKKEEIVQFFSCQRLKMTEIKNILLLCNTYT